MDPCRYSVRTILLPKLVLFTSYHLQLVPWDNHIPADSAHPRGAPVRRGDSDEKMLRPLSTVLIAECEEERYSTRIRPQIETRKVQPPFGVNSLHCVDV
jgi:hypothetical protein